VKLIDADKLLGLMSDPMFKEGFRETMKIIIKNTPTVDAVPVVRGEWIKNPTKDSVLCSYCHADWNLFDNDTYRFCYCPNCGAKMEDKL
jgi:hypothetical protein